MKISSPIARVAVFTAIALLTASSAYSADIVERFSDPVAVRGSITKATIESIEIKKSGGDKATVTIPVSDIKSITLDGEPSDLRSARSSERIGSYDSALEKLTKARTAAGSNARVKAEIDFLIARVTASKAKTDATQLGAAKEALEKFRSTNRTNFRYLEATLLQAAIHGLAKEGDAGKVLLQEVQASAVKDYQLQAGVELGTLLLNGGDAAGALTAFDDVVAKSKADNSPAQFDGMLGQAACQRQQNQLDQAIATLKEVVDKVNQSQAATLAKAWVNMGDCHRQKGEQKAAMMAYLRVDVLYASEPAQHAEALFRLSQLWGPIGHQDRAAEAGAKLAKLYPNSQWTKSGASGG